MQVKFSAFCACVGWVHSFPGPTSLKPKKEMVSNSRMNCFGPKYSLRCFFSYPRTESTAYPSSFDFRGALEAQQTNPIWGGYVQKLLTDGYLKPRLGTDAGDHPPITPMCSATEEMLGYDAWKLYQYVCQHFIATVSPDCKYVR